LRLDISSLKEHKGKSIDFRFEENLSPLELGGRAITFKRPVVVEGSAANVESGILVKCIIETEITVGCDRCLKPVDLIVQASATEQFVRNDGSAAKGQDGVLGKDFYCFSGTEIDLQELIKENIFLSIPMKTLCDEGCMGICPSCGSDLNSVECRCYEQDTDPRMQKLEEWFQEYGGREE